MKKSLYLLMGLILAMACIAFASCGDSGDAQETEVTTEATEATTQAAGSCVYGYTGDDPAVAAAYTYMVEETAKDYDLKEGMVSVPVVSVVDRVENEDGSVDLYGYFEIYNYTVDGDTLKNESGGSYPGMMHLVKDGDAYKVERFDVVEDGESYDASARKIFGDRYEKFSQVSSDDKTREALRGEILANYVKANDLKVTKYQDYGWDPIDLTL